MNFNEFNNIVNQYGFNLNENQFSLLKQYYELLKITNEHTNITRIIEEQDVYIKHFLDSFLPAKHVDFNNKMIMDVGSGGGFPGIPLAILYPESKFTLLEPIGKKVNFLIEVKNKLNLKNVEVIQGRAEDKKEFREHFDIVISRAVSYLNLLLELCTPLTKVEGLVIAMKGERANEEIKDSKNAIKVLSLEEPIIYEDELPCLEGKRFNLVFKKRQKTNLIYPRNYSQIKKKPL